LFVTPNFRRGSIRDKRSLAGQIKRLLNAMVIVDLGGPKTERLASVVRLPIHIRVSDTRRLDRGARRVNRSSNARAVRLVSGSGLALSLKLAISRKTTPGIRHLANSAPAPRSGWKTWSLASMILKLGACCSPARQSVDTRGSILKSSRNRGRRWRPNEQRRGPLRIGCAIKSTLRYSCASKVTQRPVSFSLSSRFPRASWPLPTWPAPRRAQC
jgi:hypothetical protein